MNKPTVLTRASSQDVKDLKSLMAQMSQSKHSAHPLTLSGIQNALRDKNITVLVMRESKRIVATGTLVVINTLIGKRARFEDIVVDEGERGKGFGRAISEHLVALARKKKATSIEFTSRPSRIAAISLYEKMGFKRHETNAYRLSLTK